MLRVYEEHAVKCAREAVEYDLKGNRELAIRKYQEAIYYLRKMVDLDPGSRLSVFYIERIREYEKRIKQLKSGSPVQPPVNYVAPITKQQGMKIEQESLDLPFIIKEKLGVRWSDIIGLEKAKKAIKYSLVYPYKRPDLFPLGWPKGILLFGPPGCGKTLLAAAVATEIDALFMQIDAASVLSKWLGEAEKTVASIFSIARKYAERNKPVIIFIDELDSLLGIRQSEVGGEVRVRNQFLKEMDGILDKGKTWYIYVIGATNKPWDLDYAFIRRFQKRILVGPPSYEDRIELFEYYTRRLRLDPSVNFSMLAAKTNGFSAYDIKELCREVQMRVVEELFESGRADDFSMKPRPITMADFEEVLKTFKPSISEKVIRLYEEWNKKFGSS